MDTIKTLAAAAALLLSVDQASADFRPFAGVMISEHVGWCGDCNEVHPFAGLAYEMENGWTVSGSVFLNSFSDPGGLLGLEYQIGEGPFFVEGLLAFGYDEYDMPVAPMVRAGMEFGRNARLFVSPAPKNAKLEEWSVIVGVELRL